ncbi:TIGR02611 family protein [Kibdelosporangium aridum]|uniref:TIGR02611 family protein n=1 Tax=Kibdelosporangium aridum TaxID=2030 RepID=UPI0005272AC9
MTQRPPAETAKPPVPSGIRARIKDFRADIELRPTLRRAWRIGVTVIGLAVLTLGILIIPYPGPGWLIVFAGLAILGSEFLWAKRVLRYARGKYDAWTAWLGRQRLLVRVLVFATTTLIVVVTLWLLNTFWLLAGWVGFADRTWLQSPLLG